MSIQYDDEGRFMTCDASAIGFAREFDCFRGVISREQMVVISSGSLRIVYLKTPLTCAE